MGLFYVASKNELFSFENPHVVNNLIKFIEWKLANIYVSIV